MADEANTASGELNAAAERELAAIALRRHVFVGGLERRWVERLAGIARIRRYAPGSLIARRGEAADSLYLITCGSVELQATEDDGRVVAVQKLGTGDVLGVDWVSASRNWMVDVRALEPVSAVLLEVSELARQIDEDHDFGRALTMCALRHARLRALGGPFDALFGQEHGAGARVLGDPGSATPATRPAPR